MENLNLTDPIFLSERGVQVQPVAEYLLRNPSYALSSSIINSSNSANQEEPGIIRRCFNGLLTP